MKKEDFLLLVVALREAQNYRLTPQDIPDTLQEIMDLEFQVDEVISRFLTGEDKLE